MDNTNNFSTPSNYALNGKIMLCSVTILFIIVCIVVCFHTYARWCSTRSHHRQQRRRHRRLHQPPNTPPTGTTTMDFSSRQNGLDGSILKTIPIFVYSPTTAAVLECAVCLSEFGDCERGRTLPKCGHAFHVECIDAWFWSHTNCPLCRAPVNQQPDNAINAPDHHPAPETGSSDVVVITVTDESSAAVSEQTRDAGYSGTLPVGGFQPEWCPRKAEGLVGLAAVEVGSVENSGLGSPERNGYNKSVSL